MLFDSGVGGLSIYKKVKALLPNVNYIYIFDNYGFPYSEKTDSFIISRVVSIINQVTQHYQISLLVVACNTASIITLSTLRNTFTFPIIGVVPIMQAAVNLTNNGVIGLLATHATIRCSYIYELIAKFTNSCSVKILGSTFLVELAEAKLRGDYVSLKYIYDILRPWLKMSQPPDTIILGCTHFPLLRRELEFFFPRKTQFIDSGSIIANQIAWLVKNTKLKICYLTNNLVFCTNIDTMVVRLIPLFQQYNFIFSGTKY